MKAQKILQAARELQPQIEANRRELHKHPELGHDLEFTTAFVKEKLEEIGLEPQECGDSGLVVLVGGKKPGKCFLLRADMDALPIEEELELEFRSMHPGKMHSCGHDTHTAMLLGAAALLRDLEDEIEGTVKLMFQPGEETMSGAKSMVEAGVLENPHVDAALMMHSLIATHVPTGGVVIIDGGISFSSCDIFFHADK